MAAESGDNASAGATVAAPTAEDPEEAPTSARERSAASLAAERRMSRASMRLRIDMIQAPALDGTSETDFMESQDSYRVLLRSRKPGDSLVSARRNHYASRVNQVDSDVARLQQQLTRREHLRQENQPSREAKRKAALEREAQQRAEEERLRAEAVTAAKKKVEEETQARAAREMAALQHREALKTEALRQEEKRRRELEQWNANNQVRELEDERRLRNERDAARREREERYAAERRALEEKVRMQEEQEAQRVAAQKARLEAELEARRAAVAEAAAKEAAERAEREAEEARLAKGKHPATTPRGSPHEGLHTANPGSSRNPVVQPDATQDAPHNPLCCHISDPQICPRSLRVAARKEQLREILAQKEAAERAQREMIQMQKDKDRERVVEARKRAAQQMQQWALQELN